MANGTDAQQVSGTKIWLQRRKRYDRLLEIWIAKTPVTSSGKVIRSLKVADCYIQLGKYAEGMDCLKGLGEKVDMSDKDDEWKEEQSQKAKFYRKTIHNLATLSYKK